MEQNRGLFRMTEDDTTLFFFSGLALFHSLWTGWIAPIGLLMVRSQWFRHWEPYLPNVVKASLSVVLGVVVGCIDGVLCQTDTSVGTALLMIVGLTCFA